MTTSRTVTMRDRAIAALERRPPWPGPVPHYDHLQGPLEHSVPRGFHHLDAITSPKALDIALHQDAELYVALIERFGWCGVRIHRRFDHQVLLCRYVKELVGDRLLVEATIGFATLHLPGADMEDVVLAMTETPDEFHAQLKKQLAEGLELGKRLIDAGVDAVDEISDYCFNSGCWLSPAMFREFIFPYLHRAATEMKRAGAYFICHTDGDVMGVLDQLVEAEITALHSIQHIGQTSMAAVKAAVGDRVCLMGNVDIGALLTGPEPAIVDSTRQAILEGAPGGSFILTSANGMTREVPLENYMALHRTWQHFQYASDGTLQERT